MLHDNLVCKCGGFQMVVDVMNRACDAASIFLDIAIKVHMPKNNDNAIMVRVLGGPWKH